MKLLLAGLYESGTSVKWGKSAAAQSDGGDVYATKLYIVHYKNEVQSHKFQVQSFRLQVKSLILLTWNFELGTWSSLHYDFQVRDITSQAGYWNSVANEKRFSHPLRSEWLSKYLAQQALMLDYGCGYGRTLEDLSGAGYRNTVGADASLGMLARCRSQHPGQSLVLSDGHMLPFRDESFGAVLLFALLTCIPLDADQRFLMREIKRVLRPKGLLYISDLLLNTDARNRERYERGHEAYGTYGVFELPEGVVVRHHSPDWITELTASFEQLESAPFDVLTMNGNKSNAFQYLGRKSSAPISG
jgi:SAM-dependent methyltransferase